MEHSTTRKLINAATLSLLVLTTTSGVAGLEVMAAGSALAQSEGSGDGSAQGLDPGQPDPPPIPTPTPTPVPTLPAP
jgi:hypothetical protein